MSVAGSGLAIMDLPRSFKKRFQRERVLFIMISIYGSFVRKLNDITMRVKSN